MLNLTTVAQERLELPPSCIVAVFIPANGAAKSGIMYDLGTGPITQFLSDTYGFIKKTLVDMATMANPIELRVLEPYKVSPDDDEIKIGEGKMFFARSRIIARQELKDNDQGAHAMLFVNLTGQPRQIFIADTLYELDGVDNPKPKPKTRAKAVEKEKTDD